MRVLEVPERPKFAGSGIGSVSGAPTSVWGRPKANPMPRSAASTCIGGRLARCRPSQPVTTLRSPGLPISMKNCASKCDRDGSVEPVACTMSSCPDWYAGSSDAIAVGSPKKPSRLIAGVADPLSGRGMAIVGLSV